MNELEKLLATLLKPKIDNTNNLTVERLQSVSDGISVSDSVTVATSAPESRVGFALVGYSEVS